MKAIIFFVVLLLLVFLLILAASIPIRKKIFPGLNFFWFAGNKPNKNSLFLILFLVISFFLSLFFYNRINYHSVKKTKEKTSVEMSADQLDSICTVYRNAGYESGQNSLADSLRLKDQKIKDLRASLEKKKGTDSDSNKPKKKFSKHPKCISKVSKKKSVKVPVYTLTFNAEKQSYVEKFYYFESGQKVFISSPTSKEAIEEYKSKGFYGSLFSTLRGEIYRRTARKTAPIVDEDIQDIYTEENVDAVIDNLAPVDPGVNIVKNGKKWHFSSLEEASRYLKIPKKSFYRVN